MPLLHLMSATVTLSHAMQFLVLCQIEFALSLSPLSTLSPTLSLPLSLLSLSNPSATTFCEYFIETKDLRICLKIWPPSNDKNLYK